MENLKDNIWIEGFDTPKNFFLAPLEEITNANRIIYSGKTSDIPEEITKECVFIRDHEFVQNVGSYQGGYKDYSHEEPYEHYFGTAKESIQSACNQEYCIIFKR